LIRSLTDYIIQLITLAKSTKNIHYFEIWSHTPNDTIFRVSMRFFLIFIFLHWTQKASNAFTYFCKLKIVTEFKIIEVVRNCLKKNFRKTKIWEFADLTSLQSGSVMIKSVMTKKTLRISNGSKNEPKEIVLFSPVQIKKKYKIELVP